MKAEFNMIGCFSCNNFKESDSIKIIGRKVFWCSVYDEEAEILDRKSCHCYGFERNPKFCSKIICQDCRDNSICLARNIFRPFICSIKNCFCYITCKLRIEVDKIVLEV